MEILKVESALVCTRRIPGLGVASLRVLSSVDGRRQVAVDPVGSRRGNYVFTISGSAARYAAGDYGVLTDLTIGGIIDDAAGETESLFPAPRLQPGQTNLKPSVDGRHDDSVP